jgi:P27 family predicted phage terminase small subunit
MTPAPKHLSPSSRKLWAEILDRYELEAHHLAVLTKTLEARDRSEAARAVIERDGVLTTSRLGEVKAHPAIAIERDSRAAFLAGIKQLGLDLDGPPPPSARRR